MMSETTIYILYALVVVGVLAMVVGLVWRLIERTRDYESQLDERERAFEQQLLGEFRETIGPGGIASGVPSPRGEDDAAPRDTVATGAATAGDVGVALAEPAATGEAVTPPPVPGPSAPAPALDATGVRAATGLDALQRLRADATVEGPAVLRDELRGTLVSWNGGRQRALLVTAMPSPALLEQALKRYDGVIVAVPGTEPVVVSRLADFVLAGVKLS